MTPSMQMNPIISTGSMGMSESIITAREKQVILMVEPARWMVAHSGIANDATGSEVPDLIDCRSVTGIVAADDDVPVR